MERPAEVKAINRRTEIGVDVNTISVRNRLERGKFSEAILLQCLKAIGCDDIRVT